MKKTKKKTEKKQTYPYERATKKQLKVGTWWWCVHHREHLEVLTQSVSDRVEYIRNCKPPGEVEIRLRNLVPVLHPENLPASLLKAHRTLGKADRLSDKTYAALSKAKDLLARTPYHWKSYETRAKAVNKLRGPSRKADDAVEKAREFYQVIFLAQENALAIQHNQEYPDNTWNGTSIFGR